MPVNVPYLGRVSFMRIGKRQLKFRGPRKRNKPLFVLKTTSVPSETPYILEQWLALAERAVQARGKSYEEVMEHILAPDSPIYGKKKPKEVEEAEKKMRYVRADANIERMREKLAKYHGMSKEEFTAASALARF